MKIATKVYFGAAAAAALIASDAIYDYFTWQEAERSAELHQQAVVAEKAAARSATNAFAHLLTTLQAPPPALPAAWDDIGPAGHQAGDVLRQALDKIHTLEIVRDASADDELAKSLARLTEAGNSFEREWREFGAIVNSTPDVRTRFARNIILPRIEDDILAPLRRFQLQLEVGRLRAETALHAQSRRERQRQLVGTAFLVALLLGGLYAVNRQFIRPLRRIENEARRVNLGEQLSVGFTYTGQDELGAVARAINDAIDTLRSNAFSRTELERLVEERTAALREREKKLQENRAQLQRALDGSQLVTWEWNVFTDAAEISGLLTQILGYAPGDIPSTRAAWEQLVHPGDLERAHAASEAHVRGVTPRYEAEIRLRDAAGQWRWIRSLGRIAERDAAGRPIRIAGTHADIHARKTAEEKLARSDEQLRLALAASGSALWDYDADREEVYLDERWPEIAGGAPGARRESLRRLLELVPVEDRPEVRHAYRRVVLGHTDDYVIAHRVRRADGSLRWIRSNGKCIARDSRGRALRLIGTHTDITIAKRSEEASRRQAELYSAISETALDLLARRDSADLLQAIVDRAATLLDSPLAEISFLHEDKLLVRAHRGPLPEGAQEPVGREATLAWRALDTRQPVVVDDYSGLPDGRAAYRTAGMRAAAVFPIVHGDRAIGVLGLCRTAPDHPFNLDDLQKGQLLAQLSALVLRNATIYEDAVRVAEAKTTALRESEWQLREAQRIARLGHWEYSFENGNRFEHWSDETYRIFGLPPQSAVVDRAFFDSRLHPDDLAAVRHEVDAAFSGRRKFAMNYRIRRADGAIRHIHDEGEPKLDASGRVVGMQGIIQDVTEHRLAEIALRDSEEKFRSLFDDGPVPMVLVSYPDGQIVDINAAVTRAFGYTRDDAIGRNVMESGLWPDHATRESYVRQLATEGRLSDVAVTLKHRDGRELALVMHNRLVHLAGRSYSLNSFLDVTHLKRAETALRDSEKHYRTLVEAITQGYYVANRRSQFTYCNPAIFAIGGYTPEELVGTSCFRLIAPEARDDIVRRYKGWLADPACKTVSCEFPVQTKEGRKFWVEQTTDFVRDDRGVVIEGRNMLRDISERKQAEKALRESEERFHAVFEESPIMILLLSFPDGRIIEANSAASRGFGIEKSEALGKTSLDLMAWADPEDRTRYLQLLQAERHVTGFETRLRRRNGDVFPVLFSGSLIQIAGQHYTLNSIQDITAQRQAEARLRQTQKMESLGTLAGGIAHDFNNLLTGMLGSAELVRLELPSGHESTRWLDNIAAAGVRAKRLVQHILTFSRRTEGDYGPIDLPRVVEEALRLLGSTLPPMVEISAQLDHHCPAVRGDATQLHQVVMNLCTNAWHALPPIGGRIEVAIDCVEVDAARQLEHPDLPPGTAVRLAVADNGKGMSAEVLQRIFDPFFTTKEAGRGTGLGLAVVHGIVRSHGGTITVQSTPDVGTRFEIYFPVVASAAADAPAPATAADYPRGQGQHVLLVDDDAGPRAALAGMLEYLGYHVVIARHAPEALLKFSATPTAYDLVVADYAMPGMTGLDLARNIRLAHPELPILIVSGHLEAEQQTESSRLRIAAVLSKPPTLADLARAVAQALRPTANS
ncbi:MAG: PAS domain S-box protein [Opitutae bacterium]|nr:PAS domain S-box protein [Opitutae bacterium]